MENVASHGAFVYLTDRSAAAVYFAWGGVFGAVGFAAVVDVIAKLVTGSLGASFAVSVVLSALMALGVRITMAKRAAVLAKTDEEAAVYVLDLSRKKILDGKTRAPLADFADAYTELYMQPMQGGWTKGVRLVWPGGQRRIGSVIELAEASAQFAAWGISHKSHAQAPNE